LKYGSWCYGNPLGANDDADDALVVLAAVNSIPFLPLRFIYSLCVPKMGHRCEWVACAGVSVGGWVKLDQETSPRFCWTCSSPLRSELHHAIYFFYFLLHLPFL
jgi:hypothetical protein